MAVKKQKKKVRINNDKGNMQTRSTSTSTKKRKTQPSSQLGPWHLHDTSRNISKAKPAPEVRFPSCTLPPLWRNDLPHRHDLFPHAFRHPLLRCHHPRSKQTVSGKKLQNKNMSNSSDEQKPSHEISYELDAVWVPDHRVDARDLGRGHGRMWHMTCHV